MSHHLYLVRGIPHAVTVTEDPTVIVTDPLPKRIPSPRTACHAAQLRILDQQIAAKAKAMAAREATRPGFIQW